MKDNSKNTVIPVLHTKLKRSDESPFRSECIVCPPGVLLVARHPDSGRLLKDDYCVGCGQRYKYLDDAIAGEPLS